MASSVHGKQESPFGGVPAREAGSSAKGEKQDPQLRIVSSEDAIVFPEDAEPTDESPTVISKTVPIVEPLTSIQTTPLKDLARQGISPDALVASLRGRRLAHYELIEPIGVGGMAAVIRARDTQLDRIVALKILPPEMSAEAENVKRFHQEAKAAAKLDHENIARVFFCGEDQGLHFISFEFVEGVNLRTMLERRGKLPVAEAIRYVLQVAAGLEHAASRGVVHRDVKPSNIIISSNGRAKLVDMGLARNLERRGDRDLTQSGVTLGTFDYIAPEQALEPRDADCRCDIYSLGCTLYHIVTGQTTVPEGTPAKKLDHHQRVAPLDPRQLNPEVPDDLVVVLGRMMAKNPADRYQRPIHLIQHLMQVAQKVGAVDEVPEGVMFVETPAPAPSHTRPVLLIGAALAALVIVTMLLSLADKPPPFVRNSPDPKDNGPRALTDSGSLPKKTAAATIADLPAVAKSAQDLAAVFKDPKANKVPIAQVIDLDSSGLIYQGVSDQRLEVEPEDAQNYATIRYRYQNGGATAGLVVSGGEEVVFRRIRFELASGSPVNKTVALLAIRGGQKVIFDRCIFVQTDVPAISPNKTPLASLLVDPGKAAEQARPIVILRECLFDSNPQSGGQAAIALNGPAVLTATNCAFKPHGAFMHFRSECRQERTSIKMQNCSAFVVLGPAFRFDNQASAYVTVDQCAFTRPDNVLPPEGLPQPDLIFLADDASVKYVGRKNLYHNLNALVEFQTGDFLTKAEDFQRQLAQMNKGSEQNSRYLNQTDPAASPLHLAQPLSSADHLAFQLKAEYGDFGLINSWMGKMPVLASVKSLATPGQKIVDEKDEGRTPGVYTSVAQALSIAKHRDVILIKHEKGEREVVVQPTSLKPGISVTLKPYSDQYQPILVLDKAFRKKDTYLFEVQDGRLAFEQLEVRLDPDKADFETQSIVQLGEMAQCSFKNCVLSLKTTRNKGELNVVTFIDPNSMMKPDIPGPAPSTSARVEFQECLVRGRGDLVSLRGCRLLQVDVRQSLIALAGSLLDIHAANKVTPLDQGVHWRMDQSSVFTTDSVFALRSSQTGKGLSRTTVKLEGCLLAALTPEQKLVDATKEDDIATYLDWKCEQNFYAGFHKVRDWGDEHPESKSRHFSSILMFPKVDEQAIQALWDATPEWFQPSELDQERLTGFGLPPELRLLPAPLKSDEP